MCTGLVTSGVSGGVSSGGTKPVSGRRASSYGMMYGGVAGPLDGRDFSDKVGDGVTGGEYKRFVSAKWTVRWGVTASDVVSGTIGVLIAIMETT
jgi:hypothetical protein